MKTRKIQSLLALMFFAFPIFSFANSDFDYTLKWIKDVDSLSSDVFFVGDFYEDYNDKIKKMSEALRIKTEYKDAWLMYKNGKIDEFSLYGFKLYDLKNGKITLEDFLKDLQSYCDKVKNKQNKK